MTTGAIGAGRVLTPSKMETAPAFIGNSAMRRATHDEIARRSVFTRLVYQAPGKGHMTEGPN
jgi:hypothetical protein